MRQSGLVGLSDHMKQLSADGDPLEVLELAAQNSVSDARPRHRERLAYP